MFGFVWKPISGGALSPTLFLAPLRACQLSPGLRPGTALGLVYSAAFVFPSSCRQGGLPRLLFLPSWTCSHPGQPGKAASYLVSHLVDIYVFFLPHHNSDLPPPVDWKNKNKNNTQPKSWEFCFIQWPPPWGLIAQDLVSQRVLRNYSKEVREDQDIQEFWLKKKNVVKHQKVAVNHKRETS